MRLRTLFWNVIEWATSVPDEWVVSSDGLEPLGGWVVGRIAITRASSTIALADPNKNVTKFALLEAVSPEAAARGFRPGQLIMAKSMHNIFLRGGTYHRVTFPLEEIICRANNMPLSDFVGTDNKPLAPSTKEAAA
jgi:hypothetical protein